MSRPHWNPFHLPVAAIIDAMDDELDAEDDAADLRMFVDEIAQTGRVPGDQLGAITINLPLGNK